jgi:hypothetical protein
VDEAGQDGKLHSERREKDYAGDALRDRATDERVSEEEGGNEQQNCYKE